MISGDGLHPFSAPWCSSSVSIANPCASAYPAISTKAW